MRKIITVLCLTVCIHTMYAQNKPTKEETIAFINRTAEEAIGTIYNSTRTKEISFDLMSYRRISIMEINKDNGTIVETNKYVETQTFPSLEFLNMEKEFELMNCEVGRDDICEIWIPFKKDVKREETNNGLASYNRNESKKEVGYSSVLAILIPKGKAESVKKAFLRLTEIVKEENKDPFAD